MNDEHGFDRELERRLFLEDPLRDHDQEIGTVVSLGTWLRTEHYDRIQGTVQRHSANLLAQTAIVRKDARDTTGPDLDAFAAAFATALQQHDEEYL